MFGESQFQTFHATAIYHGTGPQALGTAAGSAHNTGHPQGRCPCPSISVILIFVAACEGAQAVEKSPRRLAERFDFDYAWDGDTLNFNRSGVDGKIALAAKSLHVTAKLGFLVSAFKGPIENEIRRVLDERLADTGPKPRPPGSSPSSSWLVGFARR